MLPDHDDNLDDGDLSLPQKPWIFSAQGVEWVRGVIPVVGLTFQVSEIL